MSRKNGVSETAAKEAVVIFVQLPAKYTKKAELTVNAGTVDAFNSAGAENVIELNGMKSELTICRK